MPMISKDKLAALTERAKTAEQDAADALDRVNDMTRQQSRLESQIEARDSMIREATSELRALTAELVETRAKIPQSDAVAAAQAANYVFAEVLADFAVSVEEMSGVTGDQAALLTMALIRGLTDAQSALALRIEQTWSRNAAEDVTVQEFTFPDYGNFWVGVDPSGKTISSDGSACNDPDCSCKTEGR